LTNCEEDGVWSTNNSSSLSSSTLTADTAVFAVFKFGLAGLETLETFGTLVVFEKFGALALVIFEALTELVAFRWGTLVGIGRYILQYLMWV
jgi:hypothetical protein